MRSLTTATESHGTHDAFDAAFKVAQNPMLPEPKWSPTEASVLAGDSLVPFPVPLQFSLPERHVRFWATTVISAGVPEARVNEDDDAGAPNGEVGCSEDLRVLPISNTRAPNTMTQEQFDPAVALFNQRHHPTSFCSTDRIHNVLDLRHIYAYVVSEFGSSSLQDRILEQDDR
jgi:hypothetical protein